MQSALTLRLPAPRPQMGNNRLGVTGVAWRARILACKALDANGWGLVSSVVECIQWCR